MRNFLHGGSWSKLLTSKLIFRIIIWQQFMIFARKSKSWMKGSGDICNPDDPEEESISSKYLLYIHVDIWNYLLSTHHKKNFINFFHIRGHSQTTWTGFGTIFTPSLPLVNGHEHFDDPPLRTTWTFDDPPPLLHSP